MVITRADRERRQSLGGSTVTTETVTRQPVTAGCLITLMLGFSLHYRPTAQTLPPCHSVLRASQLTQGLHMSPVKDRLRPDLMEV